MTVSLQKGALQGLYTRHMVRISHTCYLIGWGDYMKDNVIDLEQRRAQTQNTDTEKIKTLKIKADLENVKLVISTSLASVLILVTLANSNLLSFDSQSETKSSRGVASVQTGTSAWEDRLAEKLAATSLKQEADIGRAPSSTEQFTFGALRQS